MGKKYSIVDTIGIPELSNSSDEIWSKLKQVEKKVKAVKTYIFVLGGYEIEFFLFAMFLIHILINVFFSYRIIEGGRLTQHGLLFIHQLFTKYPKDRTIVIFTKVR